MTDRQNITELLAAWSDGDRTSLENLMPLVEQELRKIAHNYMRRENPNHTLQTTALINEAYIELNNQHSVNWQNRKHFFAISAQIMRRILLKHARDRTCAKRGGKFAHVSLEDVTVLTHEKSVELIALDEALERLSQLDPLKCTIVEMRYFGGLSVEEIGKVLDFAPVTIGVHWRLAKAWLGREINGANQMVH
ncbi:MAG: polymerase sigma factor [Acidobacteria bacterium]|jgi:RNA polymerase sigma-70 factor (ECF subfamily)|nr:polymerase sigma factor [Acidobacteriota bacterium]